MFVTFVVTEHPSHLGDERARRYEEIGGLLGEIAALPTRSVHYLDVGSLGPGPVVLSGSSAPWKAYDPADLERLGRLVLATEAPVLGICAGMQLLARFLGGRIETMAPADREELGYGPLEVLDASDLLQGLEPRATVYHDHRDEIVELPEGFRVLARTPECEIQAVAVPERRWWGTQFHPERFDEHRADGERILQNFFALAARS
jgi:GMP synthase (glutamine-hydrolysing)